MLPNASRKALEDFIDKKDDLIFMSFQEKEFFFKILVIDCRIRTNDLKITGMTP